MPKATISWGELKEEMEKRGVPDYADIWLEVEIKGVKPTLIASGWVRGFEAGTAAGSFTLRANNA